MQGITADEFLQTLFPFDLLTPDERVVVAYPDSFVSRETNEQVDYYRQMNYRPGCVTDGRGWYFCVSSVVAQRQRQVRKRLEDTRTAFVLVVDDVGTKSKLPGVEPSYALETSAGNYQWGYLIEPFDVSDDRGRDYYDSCLVSLAAAGYNDPGFRSANRLARLPGSVHKSGFRARVVNWRPDRFWALGDLMREFNVPWAQGTRRYTKVRAPGRLTSLDGIDEPLYDWLVARGQVLGYNSEFVFIECPWRAAHTDGHQGQTATGFSPYGYGRYMDRGFKCLHGHCSGRTIADFEEWARAQGAPIDLPQGVV